MRVLTVRERDRLPVDAAPDGTGLTDLEAGMLARLVPALPSGALAWEHRAVRLGPFCGVLRAGPLTLEVLPKIAGDAAGSGDARGVLVAMLRATGDLAEGSAGSAPLGLQRLHLLDIFILDFCNRVNELLRRGAIRTYEAREEDLATVRGRLQLTEHLRRNSLDRGRVHCRFDELSADNPYNRALKAVLARLLGQTLGPEARGAVNGLLRRTEDVALGPCSASDIARLRFDRLTRAWRPVFERAAWFLRGLYPDVRAGKVEGACLLFDMERLFEGFVGVRLRRQWRGAAAGGARVVLQGPQRYFALAGGAPAFRMRPDVTVVGEDGIVERVYDAKWKRLDATVAHCGVGRDDIYQMAGYAQRYGCGRLALLYPRGEGSEGGLVGAFDLCGSATPHVEVYALDLLALARGAALPAGLGPLAHGASAPA